MLSLIQIICSFVVGIFTLRYFIRRSWKKFTEDHDLTGKTIIITGANSGLGEAAAIGFAKRNARVILACRSRDRGEASRRRIIEAANGVGDVILKIIDTSKLQSVRNFCDEIKQTEERVDILVNNAGVSRHPFGRTEDDLEVSYATNYFGHFLLSNLLLDLLKKSGPGSRIINLSSFVHARAKFDLDQITPDQLLFYQRANSYTDEQMLGIIYANSKLMMMMFTNELARRTEEAGVTVNCLCPGVVRTNIIKNPNLAVAILMKILYFFGKTAEEGAHTILHCSLASDLKSGRYFRNCQDVTETDSHSLASDKDKCQRLWQLSENIVGLK